MARRELMISGARPSKAWISAGKRKGRQQQQEVQVFETGVDFQQVAELHPLLAH
jgi:hypothetical protein